MPGSHPPNEDDQLMYSPPPASGWRLWQQRIFRSLGITVSFTLLLAASLGIVYFFGVRNGRHGCDCPVTPLPPTLSSISMVSASEGWAVGKDDHYLAFILHDVDGKWTQASAPQGTPQLISVFMLSASNGWSVGGSGTILHYTGGQWISVDSPTQDILTDVFMRSAADGWAVGASGTILHYTGGVWTIALFHSIFPGLRSISMTSPDEGWAVGSGVILHYQNGAWTLLARSALPPTPIDLTSVTMLSPSEGWAVGSWANSTPILHYSKGQWSLTPISSIGGQIPGSHAALAAIAMISLTEGWAIGSDPDTGASIILHYTQGAWTQVQTKLHVSLTGISMVSASEGWAVGDQDTLLHYQHGVWSIYQA